MNKRKFLGALAATAAAVTLTGCHHYLHPRDGGRGGDRGPQGGQGGGPRGAGGQQGGRGPQGGPR
jgi:hypothetical protein